MTSFAAATGALANWSSVFVFYVALPLFFGGVFLHAIKRTAGWIDSGSPTLNHHVYARLSLALPRTQSTVCRWTGIALAVFGLWLGVRVTSSLGHQADQLRAFSRGLSSLETAGREVGLSRDWKCVSAPVPRRPRELLTFLFLGVQRYPLKNSEGGTLQVLLPSGLSAAEVNQLLNREKVYHSRVDRRALIAAPTLEAVQSNLGRYPDFASVLGWIAWLLLVPGMFALGTMTVLAVQLPAALWDRWLRHTLCHAFHGRLALEWERVRLENQRVLWKGRRYRAGMAAPNVPIAHGYLTDVVPLLPRPLRGPGKWLQTLTRLSSRRLPFGVVLVPPDLSPPSLEDRPAA